MGGRALCVQADVLVIRAEEPEQKPQLGGLFLKAQVGRYSMDHAAQVVEAGAITGCPHSPSYGREDYARSDPPDAVAVGG